MPAQADLQLDGKEGVLIRAQFGRKRSYRRLGHQACPQHLADKLDVFLPSGEKLAHRQVLRRETEANRPSHVLALETNNPPLPPRGKCRGFRSDTVRVVTERLVEGRELADGPVDQVCLGGIVERIAVDIHRAEQRIGSVGGGRQERLAADDHDLATTSNAAAGAKDVLKLFAVHVRPAGRSPSAPGPTGSRRTDCSGGGAAPLPPDRASGGGLPPTPAPGCGPIPPPPATESPETSA